MKTLKYSVIKSEDQYFKYCKIIEELVFRGNADLMEEIELLDLLIEKWDSDHNIFHEPNPVELLRSLMEDHRLKSKDLAQILKLSKGTISKIINYQNGFSKETIRKLSAHFKLRQEAFNRPYPLVNQVPSPIKTAS